MLIRRLQVTNVRNLSRVSLPQLQRINIFFGANGSGKTSLLEAAHLLLVGRSFRQSQVKPVLRDGSAECVIFAELRDDAGAALTLGMQRQRDGSKPTILLNGSAIGSLADLVHIAPVQVFSAEAFEVLQGGPTHRRQFIDWGLFHVEPSFYPTWRLAQRALKQRNTLLRHGKIARDQLALWTREYARHGEQIDLMRQSYMEELIAMAQQILSELSPAVTGLEMSYHRGWSKPHALEEALQLALDGDIQQGMTRVGPHRADLRIHAGAALAVDTLSRGQQKVLVAGLQLAQAELLRKRTSRTSIFLIDDLGAELDRVHRQKFCAVLERLDVQVLATSIEQNELIDGWSPSTAVQMFHVEHGEITPC